MPQGWGILSQNWSLPVGMSAIYWFFPEQYPRMSRPPPPGDSIDWCITGTHEKSKCSIFLEKLMRTEQFKHLLEPRLSLFYQELCWPVSVPLMENNIVPWKTIAWPEVICKFIKCLEPDLTSDNGGRLAKLTWHWLVTLTNVDHVYLKIVGHNDLELYAFYCVSGQVSMIYQLLI